MSHAIHALPTKNYMTSSEVARLLQVSPTTIARWTREGRLGCFVTLGGHRRFERTAVDELRRRLDHPAEIGDNFGHA
jgi:excisionase family DNA binding protein